MNCYSRQKLEFKLSESYIDEKAEGLILNEKKKKKEAKINIVTDSPTPAKRAKLDIQNNDADLLDVSLENIFPIDSFVSRLLKWILI